MVEVAGSQMIVGLIIGITLLIILILKTKIHAFLALIIAAATTGLIGGMAPNAVLDAISKGFGGTLASIGIIIGFGVMMGEIFEASGAAERMAQTFIKKLGKGREEIYNVHACQDTKLNFLVMNSFREFYAAA